MGKVCVHPKISGITSFVTKGYANLYGHCFKINDETLLIKRSEILRFVKLELFVFCVADNVSSSGKLFCIFIELYCNTIITELYTDY